MQQGGSRLKAQRVLRQQSRFAVDADVVAIVLIGQASHGDRLGRAQRVLEFGLKVDVLGLVTGRIRVGDVGSHQLLPGAQQIHVAFQFTGHWTDVYKRQR